MVEFGIFSGGTTNLDYKEGLEGNYYPDASFAELQDDWGKTIEDQVKVGILGDELGFERVFHTEHHHSFLGTDANSPNPILMQMAIAPETENIKLCQIANILTWRNPLRFAEEAAMLDIISDGRAEIGIGRGYQPRENETHGQYWGGTIQDQEKNRVSFEEGYEILKKAWTEDMFSYQGDHHSIPPKHTKWHHENEYMWLKDDVSEYEPEDMMDWKEEGDFYSSGNPVVAGGTTLKKLAALPKPKQDPHPQIWMPTFSPRSIKFAARNGFNAYFIVNPITTIKPLVDMYYEAAEEAGWPDHRPEYDGEQFDYGWDAEHQRGVGVGRYVFNTDAATEEELEKHKMGLKAGWSWFGSFGFNQVLVEGDEEPPHPKDVDAEMLQDYGVSFIGDSEEIIEGWCEVMEECEFEDGNLNPWFNEGLEHETVRKQMRSFSEDVMPYLREEYPSKTPQPADD